MAIAYLNDYPDKVLTIKLPKVNSLKGIIIHFSQDKQIRYNSEIKIPENKFAKKIIEALNNIYTTPEGKKVLDKLITSSNKYHIYETPSLVSGNKKAQFSLGENSEFDKPFKKLISSKKYADAKKMLEKINNLFIGAYIGNYTIAWDNNNYDGVKMNLTLAMGHEIFHAYQFEIGQCNGSFIGGFIDKIDNVILLEAQAVGYENYLRGYLYLGTKYGKTRTSYSYATIENYMEKPDWWDYLIGFDKLDVKEFKEGGVGYKIWKEDFQKMIENKWKSVLK